MQDGELIGGADVFNVTIKLPHEPFTTQVMVGTTAGGGICSY